MVSISSSQTGFMLADIQKTLARKLQTIPKESIEYAFAVWIYPTANEKAKLPDVFSVMDYSHVAQLGFLIATDPENFMSFADSLNNGLVRLMGRSIPLEGSSTGSNSFYNDALAILGLAVGADFLGDEIRITFHSWISSFTNLHNSRLVEWKRILLQAALWRVNPTLEFNTIYSNEYSDILLALKSRGINCFQQLDLDSVYQTIYKGMVYHEPDIVQVISRLVCIDYLTNHLPTISLSHPTEEQVINLLRNMNSAFKRWIWEDKAKTPTGIPQKWDVQNEYHVQSLLYFMLAPLFPEIESEFYLEPIGQLNSRADLGLPSLNLIIEVKFLRKSKKFQNMIEEVAADNSLYFKKDSVFKNKYSKMLVFLWDNTRRHEEHQVFMNGVNSLENVIGTVVISRPGILDNKDSISIEPENSQ